MPTVKIALIAHEAGHTGPMTETDYKTFEHDPAFWRVSNWVEVEFDTIKDPKEQEKIESLRSRLKEEFDKTISRLDARSKI